VVEAQTEARAMALAARIQCAIFDVDGVLTDGTLYFAADGTETKAFNVKDGFGLRRLLVAGVQVAVITGRESAIVSRRMADLGIQHVFQGQADKGRCCRDFLKSQQLDCDSVCFTGDDIFDLPVFKLVGFSIAVADAHPEVIARADWCTRSPGGRGAVREVCDLILSSQGRMTAELAHYGAV